MYIPTKRHKLQCTAIHKMINRLCYSGEKLLFIVITIQNTQIMYAESRSIKI